MKKRLESDEIKGRIRLKVWVSEWCLSMLEFESWKGGEGWSDPVGSQCTWVRAQLTDRTLHRTLPFSQTDGWKETWNILSSIGRISTI